MYFDWVVFNVGGEYVEVMDLVGVLIGGWLGVWW